MIDDKVAALMIVIGASLPKYHTTARTCQADGRLDGRDRRNHGHPAMLFDRAVWPINDRTHDERQAINGISSESTLLSCLGC